MDTDILYAIIAKYATQSKKSQQLLDIMNNLKPLKMNMFLMYFTGATRRLGKVLPEYTPEETTFLSTNFNEIDLSQCSLGELARVFILLKSQNAKYIKEIIDRGDNGEQAITLKILSLLENPKQYLLTAVNACRTNSTEVFAAIAKNNSYIQKYFNDHDFNHLVMKAIFLDLGTDNILGFPERYQAEMGKMMKDFYEERMAAKRPFPKEVLELLKKHKVL